MTVPVAVPVLVLSQGAKRVVTLKDRAQGAGTLPLTFPQPTPTHSCEARGGRHCTGGWVVCRGCSEEGSWKEGPMGGQRRGRGGAQRGRGPVGGWVANTRVHHTWVVNTRVVTLLAEILRMASDPQKQSRQGQHLQPQPSPQPQPSLQPQAEHQNQPQHKPRPQQRLVQAVYSIAAAGGLLMRATDGITVDMGGLHYAPAGGERAQGVPSIHQAPLLPSLSPSHVYLSLL